MATMRIECLCNSGLIKGAARGCGENSCAGLTCSRDRVRAEDVARTSKSPVAVARAALESAQRVLPFYTHPNSPKKFTQHPLFACLVLKTATLEIRFAGAPSSTVSETVNHRGAGVMPRAMRAS